MKKQIKRSLIIVGAIVLALPAWAGNGPGDYAESRFGSPPSRAGFGLDAMKPGEEADYWDRNAQSRWKEPADRFATKEASFNSRAPAGLVVGQQAAYDDPDAPVGPPEPQFRMGDAPEMERFAIRKKGVQEVAVIAGDLGFFPKTIFVTRDVPVRLFVTGASKNTLCIMMDSFQIRKQVRTYEIEEITFTPNQPGRYRFYCPVNGMEGTLVVKELTSS